MDECRLFLFACFLLLSSSLNVRFANSSDAYDVYESRTKSETRCERITIPMCQDMPWNMTKMPNVLGHSDQSEAAIRVHEFIPLVEINCSRHLKFFLCSVYAPMCSEQVDTPIPSCRSICEDVKSKCLPILQQFNFVWPSMLNCSRLPTPENHGLCMHFPPNWSEEKRKTNKSADQLNNWKLSKHRAPSLFNSIKPTDLTKTAADSKNGISPDLGFTQFTGVKSSPKSVIDAAANREEQEAKKSEKSADTADLQTDNSIEQTTATAVCPLHFVALPAVLQRSKNSTEHCVQKCGDDVLFTRADKVFVEHWMAVWCWICFVATIFTVATFWIDSYRFRYPEKAIAFISICYCLLSVAYLIRTHAGAQFVSCDRTQAGKHYLTIEGLENSGCIIVFLLIYYFGTAAIIWWLLLTVTWYMVAVNHWTPEKMEANASFLHLFAWAVPALFTIVLLTVRHVDGDELTGLCFVGHRDPNAVLIFVIVPLCVAALTAACILCAGCISYFCRCCRSSTLFKNTSNQVHKRNDRLYTRIGLFSGVYLISVTCIIGCYVYEYMHWQRWRTEAIKRAFDCQATNVDTKCRLTESVPQKEIFVMKIFLSLVLGIFSGIWTCNAKTWHSWSQFYTSTFTRRRQRRTFIPTSGVAVRHSSYMHIPPYSQSEQQHITGSSSVPHINRISGQTYPYASIKSQRTRRSYHKHLNEITQL